MHSNEIVANADESGTTVPDPGTEAVERVKTRMQETGAEWQTALHDLVNDGELCS